MSSEDDLPEGSGSSAPPVPTGAAVEASGAAKPEAPSSADGGEAVADPIDPDYGTE